MCRLTFPFKYYRIRLLFAVLCGLSVLGPVIAQTPTTGWTVWKGPIRMFAPANSPFLAYDTQTGKVQWLLGDGNQKEALLPESIRKGFDTMSWDRVGRLWVFSDPLEQQRTAFASVDGAKPEWAVFDGDPQGDRPWLDREAAFRSAGTAFESEQEPVSLFADGTAPYQVWIHPRGQIAYLNERGRVCWYNGNTWVSPREGKEISNDHVSKLLGFSPDGRLLAQGRMGVYGLRVADDGTRTWELLRKRSPQSSSPPDLVKKVESLPDAVMRTTGHPAIQWSLSPPDAYLTVEGVTEALLTEIPADHPFMAFRGAVGMRQDTQDRLWYYGRTRSKGINQIAVATQKIPKGLVSENAHVTVTEKRSLEDVLGTADLNGREAFSQVRFRAPDKTRWTAWVPAEGLPRLDAGEYVMELKAGSIRPPFFVYRKNLTLIVTFNAVNRIQEWIQVLSAGSPVERNQAEVALAGVLKEAVPHLKNTLDSSEDPEQFFRIQRLLKLWGQQELEELF